MLNNFFHTNIIALVRKGISVRITKFRIGMTTKNCLIQLPLKLMKLPKVDLRVLFL